MKEDVLDNSNPVLAEIPIGGTLGILAYGYRGIMEWRQLRHDAFEKINAERQSQTKKANEEN